MAEEKKVVGIPWEKKPLEGEELRKKAQEVADGFLGKFMAAFL